MCDGKVLRTEQ